MGTDNARRLDDEAVNDLEDCAIEDSMAQRVRAFRELSRKLRRQTVGTHQTPSGILIREDRESGHRDA